MMTLDEFETLVRAVFGGDVESVYADDGFDHYSAEIGLGGWPINVVSFGVNETWDWLVEAWLAEDGWECEGSSLSDVLCQVLGEVLPFEDMDDLPSDRREVFERARHFIERAIDAARDAQR